MNNIIQLKERFKVKLIPGKGKTIANFIAKFNKFQFVFLLLIIIQSSFIQVAKSQCAAGGSRNPSSAVTAGTGALTTISTTINEGEYSRINNIVSGSSYKISINAPTDIITVRLSSGTLVGWGVGSVIVTAPGSGDLYVYWNTSSCGSGTTNRTTTIQAIPTITSLGSTSGCPGASITINGTNFTGVTAADVTIGGTAVSAITSSTTTQIVATTGIGTTGNVIVSNAAGSGTSAATYTFNATSPVYTVTGGGNDCSSGSGVPVGLSGSQSGSQYQLYRGGVSVGSAVTGTGSALNFGNQNTSGTYTVIATKTSSGCSNNMSGSAIVTISTASTVNAGSTVNTCQSFAPSAITLSGSSVGGGATTGAWSVTSGSGTLSSTAQTASPSTVTFTVTTNYSGTVVLTLTSNASGSCPVVAATKTINVISAPTVTITPNYCIGGGVVRLTCNTQTSYLWSTGATSQFIDVTVANIYTVTGTNASGCLANASINVGQELVTNGNFNSGNTAFTSNYIYTSAANGLNPEGYYGVGPNANFYHTNFFGKDHTTTTGNFMIVNGSPNTDLVWQQNITVIPNTVYYFSAWAMSVNAVSPFAQLSFSVNGSQIGTVVTLTAGPTSNSAPNNWIRFFGSWNSGSNTTANISIVDLQTAAGGNDFGLDDISFSTLSPIILSTTATSNTPVCSGNALNLTAGITGGNSPYTYAWTGPASYSSTSQNPVITSAVSANAGAYSVTISDVNGCTATASTLSVVINPLPVDKTPAALTSTICTGSSTTIQLPLSQSGVNYQLRNNASNAPVGSVVAGTDGTISFATGTLATTTTFNVFATNVSTGCNVQMTNTVTVTVGSLWIGGASGNWSLAGNWCDGIPTATTNVIIPAGITVNIQSLNAIANSVAIASTSSLVMTGAYNLSISAGGSFTNNGTFNASASTGTVAFLGSGTISGTTNFKNIDSYGALNFGTASTVTGTFSLQPGGSVTGNAPVYSCPSSTLLYRTGGTFTRRIEWANGTSGAGYPANVIVQNNTVINFPVNGQGYICNDLTIESASSLRQDLAGGSALLNVGRNITINGTLALGSATGGDINLGGNWTRNAGGVFISNDRKVTFDGTGNFSGNGTSLSTISAPASSAKDNEGGFGGEKFAHLWINKTAITDSVVLLSNITVTKELGLTQGTFSLRNSDVTLVSNISNTADIAPVTTPANVSVRYAGTGKFVVQRYIHNPTAVRSWRLLASPLQSGTAPSINSAYQEGVVNPDKNNPNGSGGIYNPWPGYGTHITGPGGTYSAANGYDQGTNASSILYANAGISSWLTPASTITTKVTDQQGWMLFVRGDRSFVIGSQYTPSQNAILEPKGRINIGNITLPVVAGKQVIGNPYPSAISLINVNISAALGKSSTYYRWDPKMFTSYSQPGKWVTFTGISNSFVQTTSSSSYDAIGTIESGEAFAVDVVTAGNIVFHESDKKQLSSSLIGIANGVTPAPNNGLDLALFRSDIFVNNGGVYTLTDGVLNVFNATYNNLVDEEDAKKMITFNTKESLSILTDTTKLAIEKRTNIRVTDTINFSLSKFNQLHYQFRFVANGFDPLMDAFLEDKFTNTRTSINMFDTSFIDFSISADPLSQAADRFRVIFKSSAGVLPVTFTKVQGYLQNNNIAVDWQVENELNIKEYQVEKSLDGLHFENVNTTLALGNSNSVRNYNWMDENAVKGNNYYRIISIGFDEKKQFSQVVKVIVGVSKSSLGIYPNPVTDGVIKLRFENMEKGNYTVQLINQLGQNLLSSSVNYEGGNFTKEFKIDKSILNGCCTLKIIKPNNEIVRQKIILN